MGYSVLPPPTARTKWSLHNAYLLLSLPFSFSPLASGQGLNCSALLSITVTTDSNGPVAVASSSRFPAHCFPLYPQIQGSVFLNYLPAVKFCHELFPEGFCGCRFLCLEHCKTHRLTFSTWLTHAWGRSSHSSTCESLRLISPVLG